MSLRITDKRGVADHLKVGVRTVSLWMTERKIPYYKIGRTVRFDLDAVEESLSRFRVNARKPLACLPFFLALALQITTLHT